MQNIFEKISKILKIIFRGSKIWKIRNTAFDQKIQFGFEYDRPTSY